VTLFANFLTRLVARLVLYEPPVSLSAKEHRSNRYQLPAMLVEAGKYCAY
jgi:hypothetical protein